MDRDYGIPKLLRNWGNRGIPKLLRNYSEIREPWNSEITPKLGTVELCNYSEITPKLWDWDRGRGTPKTVACYSPLLVLVCCSVSQDPPGRLKTLLLRSVFYTLCRQRSANQQSRMPTRHLADQSAIASRRTPLFYRLFYRSPCVNIY